MVTGSSVCKLASYGAIVSLSVTAIPAAREQVNALVKPWMCAGPSFFRVWWWPAGSLCIIGSLFLRSRVSIRKSRRKKAHETVAKVCFAAGWD